MSPDGSLPPAPPGMAGVWPRVAHLLAHQRAQIAIESNIQAQQRGMVRDGCFPMPSPWSDRSEDICTRSWCHEYQFFYEFATDTADRYFWVTGQLDRGYALDTIWFPSQRIAITTYPPSASPGLFDRFAQVLAETPAKPDWALPPVATPRVAVTGFQHFMHMIWNQLPALDQLAGTDLPGDFRIAVQCEPFGPTVALFPEFAHVIDYIRNEDVLHANARNGLVLGLGSWTITASTQARVRRVCAAEAGPDVVPRRDRFREAHGPIFWVSVKPPKRTMSDQVETLSALVTALAAAYPSAGFILNGASLPWDLAGNSNYPPWFHAVSSYAVEGSASIIEAVMARVGPRVRDHVVALNEVTACEEVVWGEIASFYICHGGTMQNKIGWIHQTPGFIHSNRIFLQTYRAMPPPVVPIPAYFYAPDDIIVDDDPSHYSAIELARRDQNYSFTSIGALVGAVTDAIRSASVA